MNGPADIPTVDKPAIDPVTIDPSRQSEFASAILSMPYEEIEPVYLQEGEDYQILEYAAGVPLYYAPNPLNDIFSFSMSIEVGTEENDLLSLGGAVMGKAGTVDLPLEELQKQWYRLGSEFGFSSGPNETVISISGMDPQFEDSLALMLELARNPQTDAATFDELKNSILQARRDQREDPAAISQALRTFGLESVLDAGAPLVVFAPGAEFGAAKRWPESHFAGLAQAILAQKPQAQVVLLVQAV